MRATASTLPVAASAVLALVTSLAVQVAHGVSTVRRIADCVPSNATGILVGDRLSVYQRRTGVPRVCDRVTGRRQKLAFDDDETVVFEPPAIAVAGPTVAYAFYSPPEGADTTSSDRFLRVEAVGEPPPGYPLRRLFGADVSAFKIGRMAVTPRGGVAFTACQATVYLERDLATGRRGRCRRPGATIGVYQRNSYGPVSGTDALILVAKGRNIDPLSLRVDGASLLWRRDGRVEHVPFE